MNMLNEVFEKLAKEAVEKDFEEFLDSIVEKTYRGDSDEVKEKGKEKSKLKTMRIVSNYCTKSFNKYN